MKKKQRKKQTKKNKKIRISNLFLVIIVSIIFIGGFVKTIAMPESINSYENRTAYNYEKPTIKTIINKEFQDNIELTLGDQIPMATTMKKSYNAVNAISNYYVMKEVAKDYCDNNYVTMMPGLTTFGCEDIIVYYPRHLENEQSRLDLRIENINKAIKSTKAKAYVYYIEKDTEIDFTNNYKTNISQYVADNVNTKNTHIYKINSFEEFTRDFYETDHHWNLDGSYRGYLELAELLKIKTPLEHGEKRCIPESFTGSKASVSGASIIYKEDFCAYDYELPEHSIKVNGENDIYSLFTLKPDNSPVYGDFYGWDYGEIVVDYNQKKKDNILLIGESYDNAILELIASHYNKTYSIDLRHYERTFGENFDYIKYVKENDIDKVVFIGNIDFFVSEDFNLEVE